MQLGFAFRLYAQNFRANRNLNFLSIGIIAFAFVILGLFLLVAKNLDSVAEKWGEQIQVVIFLKRDIGEKEKKDLEKNLKGRQEVKGLNYVSSEDAYQRLKKMLQDRSAVLDGLERNPLPASFEIQLDKKYRNLASIQRFAEEVKKNPGVDEVFYGQKWLKNFLALVRIFRILVFAIGGLIFLASGFIIYNTVKLTVYSRREEIGIMKLVGATDGFLRIPFLLEGVTQAVSASLIAIFLLWLTWLLFKNFLQVPFQLFSQAGISFLDPGQMLLLIGSAAMLGILGSMVSFQEFLKV